MPKRQAAQPFPFEIWLNVTFDNVPKANRNGAKSALTKIRGWSTGLIGETSAALRYTYTRNRTVSISRRAQRILQRAGAPRPRIECFVVWRVDLKFRRPLDESIYARVIQATKETPGALDSHGLGNDRAGVYVEFKGEPSAEALRRIESLARPYVAA
jgi:hypothetical protein